MNAPLNAPLLDQLMLPRPEWDRPNPAFDRGYSDGFWGRTMRLDLTSSGDYRDGYCCGLSDSHDEPMIHEWDDPEEIPF
jgi:hypothetical protein